MDVIEKMIAAAKDIREPHREDAINPAHYKTDGIECIDAMEAAMGLDGVREFCKGNAIKYLWRIGKKDDSLQEMEKVKWYIEKWIELEKKKRGK